MLFMKRASSRGCSPSCFSSRAGLPRGNESSMLSRSTTRTQSQTETRRPAVVNGAAAVPKTCATDHRLHAKGIVQCSMRSYTYPICRSSPHLGNGSTKCMCEIAIWPQLRRRDGHSNLLPRSYCRL